MQWLKHSGLLVVALIVIGFAAEARAEHVDWSQYIDHSAPAKAAPAPDQPQTAAPAKKSRVAKKKVAAKRKVKARSKKRR